MRDNSLHQAHTQRRTRERTIMCVSGLVCLTLCSAFPGSHAFSGGALRCAQHLGERSHSRPVTTQIPHLSSFRSSLPLHSEGNKLIGLRPLALRNSERHVQSQFCSALSACARRRRDKVLVARFQPETSSGQEALPKEELRTLYPATDFSEEGMLKVDEIHNLKYRVYGNPNATRTALFLHGGPGAGCFPNHARFFDPERYRIVLFDQRGCGGSTPRGCAIDNDTWRLISDVEALRVDRKVEAWDVVLGGSWGVTLAVAYAQEHPDRVKAMVLRGVCLMRRKEIGWLFGPDGGASSLAPRGYSKFLADVPKSQRSSLEGVLDSYVERLFGDDTKIRDTAARSWSSWEFTVSGLNLATAKPSNETDFQGRVLEWNGTEWLVDGVLEEEVERQARARMMARFQAAKREREANVTAANGTIANSTDANKEAAAASNNTAASSESSTNASKTPGNASANGSDSAPAQAMLTCLYSARQAFMDDGLLLQDERLQRIQHIPCIAVQGAADLICPPVTAYDLHMAWPEMNLRIVKGSGHSMYDPGITSELVKATDSLLELPS